ncbi:hypothetical protein AAON49_12635 [Pseudotenacibaculum sp. MALMAid0570]|uniref:hypothetical protein n=1 Tax=Pseudotenacibaculum sp. MALMAid0570 TaxID=3143938 RepID=UPI0032E04143
MGILNSSIIGTIISMILIYSLLSILVSILLELWNSIKNIRAENLQKNIGLLLGQKLAGEFYKHYMISGQITDKNKRPDNISKELFVQVFTDIILKGENTINEEVKKTETVEKDKTATSTKPIEVVQKAITSMDKDSKLKELLEAFHFKSKNLAEFEGYVEDWYEDFMKRTSSWYKKKQRPKLFVTGLLVAILLNVDSVFLFNVISKNDALRNELVSVAENVNDEYQKLDENQRENIDELFNVSKIGLKKAKSDLTIDTSKKSTIAMNKEEINKYLGKVEELLIMTDTVAAKKYTKTNEAFNMIADLSLPIGWKKDSAPLSWICSKKDPDKKEENTTALKKYINDRNQNSSNFIFYLFGILVTAGSLSFGAPFWFDILGKVIAIKNIGRSKASKTKKAE